MEEKTSQPEAKKRRLDVEPQTEEKPPLFLFGFEELSDIKTEVEEEQPQQELKPETMNPVHSATRKMLEDGKTGFEEEQQHRESKPETMTSGDSSTTEMQGAVKEPSLQLSPTAQLLVEPKMEPIVQNPIEVKTEEPDDYPDMYVSDVKDELNWEYSNEPSTSGSYVVPKQEEVEQMPDGSYVTHVERFDPDLIRDAVNEIYDYTRRVTTLKEPKQEIQDEPTTSSATEQQQSSEDPSADIVKNEIHDKIFSVFEKNQHPSFTTLGELANEHNIPLSSVFEEFEHLRNINRVLCPPADSCNRIRKQFQLNKMIPKNARTGTSSGTSSGMLSSRDLSPAERLLLDEEFFKLKLNNLLSDMNNQQLQSIIDKTKINSESIQTQFQIYKMKRIQESSMFTFRDDEAHFLQNQHPTIEEMIAIAEKTGTDYTIVFRKFDLFRHLRNVVCEPNDTCERVRGYFNLQTPTRGYLNTATKAALNKEFTNFELSGKEITLGHFHLIREKVDLRICVIQKEYAIRQSLKKVAIFDENYSVHGKLQSAASRGSIVSVFEKNNHPSLEELSVLSHQLVLPFPTVFKQFERLRKTNHVYCEPGDNCYQIQKQLEAVNKANKLASLPDLGAKKKSMLTKEFQKLKMEKVKHKLTEEEIQKIMRNTSIDVFNIENEFEIFKKKRAVALSSFAFNGDEEHYNQNKHPSIEQMMNIAQMARADYTTVFRRFDQLRHFENITCPQNDTCYRVRRYFNPQLPVVDELTEEMKAELNLEFDRLGVYETGLSTPYLHLIREKFNLKNSVIQQIYYSNRPERIKKPILQKLRQKFNQNPNPSEQQMREMAQEYKLKQVQLMKWFSKARTIVAKQRAENSGF